MKNYFSSLRHRIATWERSGRYASPVFQSIHNLTFPRPFALVQISASSHFVKNFRRRFCRSLHFNFSRFFLFFSSFFWKCRDEQGPDLNVTEHVWIRLERNAREARCQKHKTTFWTCKAVRQREKSGASLLENYAHCFKIEYISALVIDTKLRKGGRTFRDLVSRLQSRNLSSRNFLKWFIFSGFVPRSTTSTLSRVRYF